MKFCWLFFFLWFVLAFVSLKAQKSGLDTVKVVAQTKYGDLMFYRKNCSKSKLEFVQSGNKLIFDEGVEKELKDRHMTKDKVTMKFTLDNYGKIASCEIIKPSKIETLNMFLLNLFTDAIAKLSSTNYSLSCRRKNKVFMVPVTYEASKKR